MTYLEAIFFTEKIKENGVISESFKLLEDGTVVEHTITKLSEEGIEMLELAVKAMELQVKETVLIKHGKAGKIAYCPVCYNMLSTTGERKSVTQKFCENCGKLLDWSAE